MYLTLKIGSKCPKPCVIQIHTSRYSYFIKTYYFLYHSLNPERRRRGLGGLDFFDKIASATGGLIVHTTSTFLGSILGSFVTVRTTYVNEYTCMDIKFMVQIKSTICWA